MCASLGASYVSSLSSVISNGTAWPVDVKGFVTRHKVRHVQITFDGLKANHDKRRRFRNRNEGSSFDAAVELVDLLVQCAKVDLRFNVDINNKTDLLPFLALAESRGWLSAPFQVRIQPARISAYSERSAFLRGHEVPLQEFESLKTAAASKLAASVSVLDSHAPEAYPYPRTSVCAALARDSIVVGADRKTYRCGLQVSESGRAVGSLYGLKGGADASWWAAYDPTTDETCSRCSFLPVCMAGCPKRHLERDQQAILEQGAYWRQNLARLIGRAAGHVDVDNYVIPESEQFRG
jgi:uncharacterized protein